MARLRTLPGMRPTWIVLLATVSVALVVSACGSPTAPAQVTSGIGPMEPAGPPAPAGMAVVSLAELPAEAAGTMVLIETNGPFPYRQDGAIFENREGLLPARDEAYYREYTVPTPGEADRGARRIVAGANGERYWTADHYASFAWIAP